MVGREEHQQHVGHRVEQQGEQVAVGSTQADARAQGAAEENHAIDRSCYQQRGENIEGAVGACELAQPSVELVERPTEEGVERMAVGVIVDVPARHHDDGHRVVARDMEMVEQGAPEIATVGGGGQEGLQLGHEKTVETDRHHEGEQCGQPLFALDGEQMAQGTAAVAEEGWNVHGERNLCRMAA